MIRLAWPHAALNPNSRVHWSQRAKKAKKHRAYAKIECRLAGLVLPEIPESGRLDLHIEFYPPDKRKRDDDNLLSMFKPYRDGIADYFGIDDSIFISHPVIMGIEKYGCVRVKILGKPLR